MILSQLSGGLLSLHLLPFLIARILLIFICPFRHSGEAGLVMLFEYLNAILNLLILWSEELLIDLLLLLVLQRRGVPAAHPLLLLLVLLGQHLGGIDVIGG